MILIIQYLLLSWIPTATIIILIIEKIYHFQIIVDSKLSEEGLPYLNMYMFTCTGHNLSTCTLYTVKALNSVKTIFKIHYCWCFFYTTMVIHYNYTYVQNSWWI